MKQKLIITIAALLIMQAFCFAQSIRATYPSIRPIVSEYEIEYIEASQGIDLLLLDGTGEGLSAQVEDYAVDKLRITVLNGKLRFSKMTGVPAGERITVYININGTPVSNIKLLDDASALSRGVIDVHNLTVDMTDRSRIAIRTKGRLRVNAPHPYSISKEEKFYSAFSIGK